MGKVENQTPVISRWHWCVSNHNKKKNFLSSQKWLDWQHSIYRNSNWKKKKKTTKNHKPTYVTVLYKRERLVTLEQPLTAVRRAGDDSCLDTVWALQSRWRVPHQLQKQHRSSTRKPLRWDFSGLRFDFFLHLWRGELVAFGNFLQL